MRILFVTRKYPPSTGGMENTAYELRRAFASTQEVRLIKWGGSNKWLPVVYPWLTVRALWASLTYRPDVVYLQDGIMAPLGWLVKLVSRRPTVMTIHGLEATHEGKLYRLLIPPFIRRQTQLVAVSEETKRVIDASIPNSRVVIIHNGIRDVFYAKTKRQDNLRTIARETGLDFQALEQSRILYSNGRLVRRKGVQWFVENVMPELVGESDQPLCYLISSTGPDQAAIEETIRERNLGKQVKLLGRIPDELRAVLYNTADIFVMPNIPVLNDMEGFGLVALEAASCGTTVIASGLEGISDAIRDKNNGLLVEPQNADAYRTVILATLHKPPLKPAAVRAYTLEHYSWETAAAQYEAVMQKVSKP